MPWPIILPTYSSEYIQQYQFQSILLRKTGPWHLVFAVLRKVHEHPASTKTFSLTVALLYSMCLLWQTTSALLAWSHFWSGWDFDCFLATINHNHWINIHNKRNVSSLETRMPRAINRVVSWEPGSLGSLAKQDRALCFTPIWCLIHPQISVLWIEVWCVAVREVVPWQSFWIFNN